MATCRRKELAQFLPGHPMASSASADAQARLDGALNSAPLGAPLVALISYAYLRLLGARGVADATHGALLNANYLASRLSPHYSVLFQNRAGFVAHEFIIDCRPFKALGIEAIDIAKRLQDYGSSAFKQHSDHIRNS